MAKYFAAGDGTKTNPYQIWNYRHLFNIGQISGASYVKLMQDIDLADCPYSGYTLDGTFEGEFDGNHKSIINMYEILTKKLAKDSVIKDTYLVGVNSVTDGKKGIQRYEGTFTDENSGTIKDCAVINSNYDTHNDTYNVGLICERNSSSGVITGCKVVNCSIICKAGYVGGIVGRNEGTVSDCFFDGKITDASNLNEAYGGIVGFNYGSKAIVDKCYSNIVIEGQPKKGGIVGFLSGGLVSNCVSNYIPDDVWSIVRSQSKNQGSIVGDTASGVSNSNVSNNQGAIISKPASNGTPEGNKELEKLESIWNIYNGALSTSGKNTLVDPLSNAVIATKVANKTGMKKISFSLNSYPSYETVAYNTYFQAVEKVLATAENKPENKPENNPENKPGDTSGNKTDDKKYENKKENTVATITDETKKTVTYVAPKDTSKKQIVIPKSIVINGKTYKISGIKAKAFKGCTHLTIIIINSVTLDSKNVEKGAFEGVTSKTTIKVPKSKVDAYKKLFINKGLSKKVKVVANGTSNAFKLNKYFTYTQKANGKEKSFTFIGTGKPMSIYVKAIKGKGTLWVRDSKNKIAGFTYYPVEKKAYANTACFTFKTQKGKKYVATVDRHHLLKGDFTFKINISTKGNTKLNCPKIKWPAKAFKYNKAKKTLTINWKRAKDHSYEVWYSTSKNGKYKRLRYEPETNKNSCTVKKLKKGKTYYFKVRSVRDYLSDVRYIGPFSVVKSFKIPK